MPGCGRRGGAGTLRARDDARRDRQDHHAQPGGAGPPPRPILYVAFNSDTLVLKFADGAQSAASATLPVATQIDESAFMATYGQIIALGGDFDGCPSLKPSSDGQDVGQTATFFKKACPWTLATVAHSLQKEGQPQSRA